MELTRTDMNMSKPMVLRTPARLGALPITSGWSARVKARLMTGLRAYFAVVEREGR